MRKVIIATTCMALLALVFSCKNQQKPEAPKEAIVGDLSFKKTAGADCEKPDTLRFDCLQIDLTWPNVEQGSEVLKKSVSAWAASFLTGLLTAYPDGAQAKATTVEAAAQAFIESHEVSVRENPGSPSNHWAADSKHHTLLNDGKHLTLEIEAYIFTGGAHGTPIASVATFDVATGKILTWDDLVTDTAALKLLAEKTYRAERADIFNPTDGSEPFQFDDIFQFALPQNYGLTEDGIYCHYLAYEVGPYAIGSTRMTIPFDELGALLKIQPPSPRTGSMEEIPDFYEMQGDSVAIPMFEIEVRVSPKAAERLSKQKETIIVAAMFYGFPANEKDADETGQMGILNQDKELTGDQRLARFEGLKFSKKQLDKLEDKDIRLLINVYSGRKSSENNLLSCGLADVPASQFGGKRYSIQCNLIEESPAANDGPTIAFALPASGENAAGPLPISVACNEQGEIFWLGNPVKDLEELMENLRPVLEDLKKNGAKQLPDLRTDGCMMGNSGAIREEYEALKENVMEPAGKDSAKETPQEYKQAEPAKTKAKKTATKPASTKKTETKKAAPANSTTPSVTLNQKGEINLNGKKVTLENLRKELQAALLTQNVIPDKLELKTTGETGMGMRGEVRTVIDESIAGAKWVRKKTAIETLNTAVGKKLKTSTQLELAAYQTSGAFAFVSARPKQADGKAIDYSKSSYAKYATSGSFADHTIGLLKFENGKWDLLTYSIGVSKPPVEIWVKNYNAPKSLFGK